MLNTAVFYVSATCNLNCSYCSIDKNEILIEIDKKIKDSYSNVDYYMDRLNKYFPTIDQLKKIEIWGGESVIVLDRIYPLLSKIFEKYPYINSFFISTNFSYPQWNDKIFEFIDFLQSYGNRKFFFNLQLSCDGPEYINDAGRGIGTTKKCLDNYKLFIQRLKEYQFQSNFNMEIVLKPTLDIVNLRKLNTKEKIIEYYQFFENNFLYSLHKLNIDNLSINNPIPNTAEPCPATQDDGKFFAWFCKTCKEIEDENITCNYFKYYKNIMMFKDILFPIEDASGFELTTPGAICGSGSTFIGILPDNLNSICHEGFSYLLDDYKKIAQKSNRLTSGTIVFDKNIGEQINHYCLTDKQNEQYMNYIKYFKKQNTAELAVLANEILLLAMIGQIDSKYCAQPKAVEAAKMFQSHFVFCPKSNYNVTGSIYLIPIGLLRLIFNGASQFIGDV